MKLYYYKPQGANHETPINAQNRAQALNAIKNWFLTGVVITIRPCYADTGKAYKLTRSPHDPRARVFKIYKEA